MGDAAALPAAHQAEAAPPEAIPLAPPAAQGVPEALLPPVPLLARDAVQGVDRGACLPARNARR